MLSCICISLCGNCKCKRLPKRLPSSQLWGHPTWTLYTALTPSCFLLSCDAALHQFPPCNKFKPHNVWGWEGKQLHVALRSLFEWIIFVRLSLCHLQSPQASRDTCTGASKAEVPRTIASASTPTHSTSTGPTGPCSCNSAAFGAKNGDEDGAGSPAHPTGLFPAAGRKMLQLPAGLAVTRVEIKENLRCRGELSRSL